MRRSVVVVIILCCVGLSQLNFTGTKSAVPTTRNYILTEIEAIESALDGMIANTSKNRQKLYFEAREHYKHIEYFIEFVSPRESKYLINGALVPKHDQENGRTIVEPQGFQVIEELLFSGERLDYAEFSAEVKALSSQFRVLKAYYESVETSDAQLLEMAQLELHRLASLTLNGYDASYTKNNIDEAIWSLKGIEQLILNFEFTSAQNAETDKCFGTVMKRLSKAQKFLHSNTDYNTFDRLTFITQNLTPLNAAIVDFHHVAGINWTNGKRALKLQEKNLFAGNTLDQRYFSMYFNDTTGLALQAELGHFLFFDPVLSGNNERSCASCHHPDKGFAETLTTSLAFDRESKLARNAPGLLNVLYQRAFFHDGRVEQLEEQALHVIHNKEEMGSSLEKCVEKLSQSDEYKELFKKAFPNQKQAITPYSIQKALSEYEKTLTSFNSRFDKYLKGDATALNQREHNGYNIFSGKALCGSCHFFPVFNGTVPPIYADSEFEVLGTPTSPTDKKISTDIGRYKVTQLKEHIHSYKTPTVRNVDITAPYMHNGSFSKLEEVVDFYNKGGGRGQGFEVENQTLPFDSLQLSVTEQQDVILFMRSLTDASSVLPAPTHLPSFPTGSTFNNRKVGGSY